MRPLYIQQYGQTYPADTQTPISLYLDLVGDEPGILLESAEIDGRLGRYSLIAWDFRLQITCRQGRLECQGPDPRLAGVKEFNQQEFLPGLRALLRSLNLLPPQGQGVEYPPMTRSLVGCFGYGLAGLLEPKLCPVLPPESARASLFLPGQQILFDHLHQRCLFISLDKTCKPRVRSRVGRSEAGPEIGPVATDPDKATFCRRVEETRELIKAGQAIQVVLSTRFQAGFSGDPFVLYRRLRQVNPSPYMFYQKLPECTLIGSSPELLVRCRDNILEERPIAGTRVRGKNQARDEGLAEELLADPKERAEHVMLVDLGRNDLGRIAATGSIRVEKFMQVERFSHVMHLTSYLQARLQPDLDWLDVLRACFPAGTVSGAPKIRAMEIISQMESLDRGLYAGAVGWLGLDRESLNLDTGILIRSLWIEGNTVSWQAGAGIVMDSNPEQEWRECLNKARVIQQVLKQQGGSDAFAHR
ncbi:MAG: anthranilate synthase component I family protein [Thermodesulfobacteriota bacterium]